ncbi:hypothetical protein ACWGCW_01100 [Streptomyces sp. NPDC054933]
MATTEPAPRPGVFARFNETLARRATLVFGTMWMFYAFTVYGLLPLIFPNATVTLLYWSNVVQMIALPLIMVGTNILGRDSEHRSLETHDAVMEELGILRDKHEAQQQTVDALHDKVSELHDLHIEGHLPERIVKP